MPPSGCRSAAREGARTHARPRTARASPCTDLKPFEPRLRGSLAGHRTGHVCGQQSRFPTRARNSNAHRQTVRVPSCRTAYTTMTARVRLSLPSVREARHSAGPKTARARAAAAVWLPLGRLRRAVTHATRTAVQYAYFGTVCNISFVLKRCAPGMQDDCDGQNLSP